MAIIKWIMVMMIFSLLTVSCEENSTDTGDDIIIDLKGDHQVKLG